MILNRNNNYIQSFIFLKFHFNFNKKTITLIITIITIYVIQNYQIKIKNYQNKE